MPQGWFCQNGFMARSCVPFIHSLPLSYQKGKALLTGVQQTTVHESGSKKLKITVSL
jgi:hypothetical protein